MASELDYSTTPGSNVSINGVGIAGTDLPSNLDNAMREIAANRANAQPRAILKTANYAATKDDFGKTFVFSGAFQLTIPTIATLATGWNIYAEAAAGSPLTIVRSGSNTINGATSITILPGKRCRIFVSQSATDLKADIQLTALSANAALLLADTNVPRLGTPNSWTSTNGFEGVEVKMPSDFWASGYYYALSAFGALASQGSFGVALTSNGYRNAAGTWTSLAANGSTGAAQIEMLPTGLMHFKTDAVKANGSSISPTIRMTVLANGNVGIGTVSPTTELQVAGTATATTFAGSGASLTNIPAAQLTGAVPSANLSGSYSFAGLTLSSTLNLTSATPQILLTDTDTSDVGNINMGNADMRFWNSGGTFRFAGATFSTNISSFTVRYAGSDREIWHAGNLSPGPLATGTGTAPAGNLLLAGFNSSGAFATMQAPTNSLAMQSTVNNDNWFGADLTVGNGGTGASTAAAARTNLGIGPLGPLTGLAPAGNYTLAGFDDAGNAATFGPVPTSNSLALQTTVNNADWNGTDLAIVNGGTGASDVATARSNLGLGVLSTLAAGSPAPAGQVKLAGIDDAGAAAYAGSISTTGSLAFQTSVNNADWFGTDLSIANGGTGASTANAALIAFINGALTAPPAGYIKILCQADTGTPSWAWLNTSTGAVTNVTAL